MQNGWLDAMIWQILELQKRFINKNYILSEILSVYCTAYHFHVENMQRYPMNTEISLNWIRGYYEIIIKPYEQYITETLLLQTFARVAAGQNIAAKGIIPTITFKEFNELVKAAPMVLDPDHEICGATPAGFVPVNTSPDWPVQIKDYYDQVEPPLVVDSDTNKSRYGGMQKKLGLAVDHTGYDMNYDGSSGVDHSTVRETAEDARQKEEMSASFQKAEKEHKPLFNMSYEPTKTGEHACENSCPSCTGDCTR